MTTLEHYEHPLFDKLSRADKTSIGQLNSQIPEAVAAGQERLAPILAAAAPDSPLAIIIADLAQNGSDRMKVAIAALQGSLAPTGMSLELPDRIANLATGDIQENIAWTAKAARNPVLLADPLFYKFAADLRLRAIRELHDDQSAVRDTFAKITAPPFPAQLSDLDLAEVAKHLIPSNADTHAIKSEKALGVLIRRVQKNSSVAPFIDQLALAVSDPDWKPDDAVYKSAGILLFGLNLLDADKANLVKITLVATNHYLDGKIGLNRLGKLVECSRPVTTSMLGPNETFPDFVAIRDRIDAAIGSPVLSKLVGPELRYASTLGDLANFSGLNVIKGRQWIAEAIVLSKDAEAGRLDRDKFLAIWNFVDPALTHVDFAPELVTTLRAEEGNFASDGFEWDTIEGFCEAADSTALA